MKVILATGGSGGHVIPALKVAEHLVSQGHDIMFVGSMRDQGDKLRAKGWQVKDIVMKGFVGNSLWDNIKQLRLLWRACKEASTLFKQERPDVVVGFGGYACFAPVVAAWWINIPTMLHEQNYHVGKANLLLAAIVKKIASSFPQTIPSLPSSKTIWTGCPCQQPQNHIDEKELLKTFQFQADHQTIVIVGGSQGSHSINQFAFHAVKALHQVKNIQVIHVTGKEEMEYYQNLYHDLPCPSFVTDYLDPIMPAYQLSDIVICRAGATTLAELAFMQKKAIIIPYPHALNHQKANAAMYAESGFAKVLEEGQLSQDHLIECIVELLNKSADQLNADVIQQYFRQDATQRVSDEIIGVASV